MTKLIDGTPVLRGEVKGSQVYVWCKFCQKYHIHGWPDPGPGISHRVAHCFKDSSPYHDGGYFIEVDDVGRIMAEYYTRPEYIMKFVRKNKKLV